MKQLVVTLLGCCISLFGRAESANNRDTISLNGRWNYIIDPYEMGYYDYRHEPFDQSKSGKGGFYDDRKQVNKSGMGAL